VNLGEVLGRVRSLLRNARCTRPCDQAAQLKIWNRDLESRVREQVAAGAPLHWNASCQIAKGRGGQPEILAPPPRVTVVFIDLRGFTSFAESAEPEEAMELLREYHLLASSVSTRGRSSGSPATA
jgi:class 3 adenylate cyclase